MKRITTGSRAFFSGMEGYEPKDMDVVVMVERKDVGFDWMRQTSNGSRDVFEIVRRPKGELIEHAVEKAKPMAVCRFLTPGFAEAIGLEVEDLEKLKPMVERLDEKHGYLAVIYEAYRKNGGFTLTEEQRAAAFKVYQEARPKGGRLDRKTVRVARKSEEKC